MVLKSFYCHKFTPRTACAPATQASVLGPTAFAETIYKVQGHRWTITGTSLVGDINAFGADDSSLQTEGKHICG